MNQNFTRIGVAPDDWATFVLKDRLVANDAGDWGKEPDSEACGVVRGTNFTDEGELDLSDLVLRTQPERKRKEKRLLSGDIIIERSGGSEAQPVGRIGLITPEMANDNLSFSNFVQRIRLNPETNPRFVAHCLQLMYARGVTLGMQSQTTGIRNLDYSLFIRSRLPEPSTTEQTAIVRCMEIVATSINATKIAVSAAERLQLSMMRELLSGRILSDGTVRRSRDFTAHSKLGRIPRNWQAAKGRSVFKLHGAYFAGSLAFVSDPERADCLFMKVEDFNHPLNAAKIVRTEISLHLGDQARKFRSCKPGWLVIAKRGAAILHNRVRILTRATLLDPNLMAIEMLEDHSPEYFRYLLTHMNLARFLEVSSVPQLNNKDLYPRWFMMPPSSEQAEIATAIFDYERLIEAKRAKITALQRVKKSLMQNLLTGRMRLSPEAIVKLTAGASL